MWKGLFSRSQWFQSTATFTPCTPQPLSPTPTPLAPTPPVAALNPAHRYQTQRSKSSLLVLSERQFMPKLSLIYTWIHIPLTLNLSLFNWIIHQQHILSHFYVNKSSHVACWTVCVELEDFRKHYLQIYWYSFCIWCAKFGGKRTELRGERILKWPNRSSQTSPLWTALLNFTV